MVDLFFAFTSIFDLFISIRQKKALAYASAFFLSKPQAWYIIDARSTAYIISPFGAVSHHAPACIYLRLDDIQIFGLMIYRNKLRMIYKAYTLIYLRSCDIIKPRMQPTKTDVMC